MWQFLKQLQDDGIKTSEKSCQLLANLSVDSHGEICRLPAQIDQKLPEIKRIEVVLRVFLGSQEIFPKICILGGW